MGALVTGEFSPRTQAPRLVRFKSAGSRRLVVASPTITLKTVHYNGSRTVPCEGGPPACHWCEFFRAITYGYAYCFVEWTKWHDCVPSAQRVEPSPRWCIHELTESATKDILAIGEKDELETLRGLTVDLTRTKGGQFGRQHAVRAENRKLAELGVKLHIPDVTHVLEVLYYAKARLRRNTNRL
jgi:hypothetical protein